ncbi:Uncharacterized alpha/beta hydrolase domain [Microbulbifer donghaiensis]|uniref:Uncharacterized alpha/beta hydrolase domain n=1 Tax=Microbulbifer donghaiensis TaxID=494016 RepID=A0A1M5GUQ1_9GAMM|nr:DUF2235 domain-containing protein [Microbulbifer donghaiensis]SHG07423.1 Uncharacterized alpha/beta hydrolase domain [Microbulbifer donghaiensis]
MRKQRLILLFDGTWNDPEDQTNVYRLSRRIHDYDGSMRQRFFYDPGVGTSKWSRFRGGAFGWGLSKNLGEGYDWLARNYTENDEIWIFGFSRGAYTARSLVGMLRKCGLLHISTPWLIDQAEKLYRTKRIAPDCEECAKFRQLYSREINVHFLGVWDTVGSLGIPGTFLSENGKYAWHDTKLSKIVKHAYQAVALDEFRAAYNTSLWTGTKKLEQVDVEQRWFIGAHANVGGGYGTDSLADISLQWMQKKASDAGLKMDIYEPADDAWQAKPNPSYDDFLGGFYARLCRLRNKGDGKFYRQYSGDDKQHPAVNVTVDDSVWRRWLDGDDNYRPMTLTNAGLKPPEP